MMGQGAVSSSARRRLLAALSALPLAGLSPVRAFAQRVVAPYVPTPWPIVDAMLDLARIERDELLIDLGSGDGRLVVTAAKRFGARGFGVDINPELVTLANRNAMEAGVASRVRFEQRDLFQTDLREADVLTLYLLPQMVLELVPRIRAQMPAGARVVSHDYGMSPWPPDRVVELDVPEKKAISGTTYTVLYLYIVPARLAGTWRLDLPSSLASQPARLLVTQEQFKPAATLTTGSRTVELDEFVVHGDRVRMLLPPLNRGAARLLLEGRLQGGSLQGTLESTQGGGAWRASRMSADAR
ncbi:MAG: methyltransferase domain-containing protein [Burkholderiales bacterium]